MPNGTYGGVGGGVGDDSSYPIVMSFCVGEIPVFRERTEWTSIRNPGMQERALRDGTTSSIQSGRDH